MGFTLTIPDKFKSALQITTTLTVSKDYFDSERYHYDPNKVSGIKGWAGIDEAIYFKKGEVIEKQIQTIELEKNKNSFDFIYAPSPKDIKNLGGPGGGGCLYTKLTVTITEPNTGVSYAVEYPWALKLEASSVVRIDGLRQTGRD